MPRAHRRGAGGLLAAAALLAVPLPAAARAPAPASPAPHADPADAPQSPLDLVAATFGQQGGRLSLTLTTAAPLDVGALNPATGRSLCVVVATGEQPPAARICALELDGRPTLRFTRLDAAGHPVGLHRLHATVTQPDPRTLHATFTPRAAGLAVPSRFRWRAISRWTDAQAGCPQQTGGCVDYVPSGGEVPARLVRSLAAPAPAAGCAAHGPWQVRGSPRRTNAVALTFDDGPGPDTAGVLRILEREHVPATFFVIGRQIAGHAALLRRMLRDGDLLGNHSWSHADLAGAGAPAARQIEDTQRAIRRATGFTPCLLRPPYGATSGGLIGLTRSLDLVSVLWDVDPQDWREPGVAEIESTVLRQAHGGSIVLMHDGGGPRGETLAALPHVIHAFRARGYRFVTVAGLLHLKVRRRALRHVQLRERVARKSS